MAAKLVGAWRFVTDKGRLNLMFLHLLQQDRLRGRQLVCVLDLFQCHGYPLMTLIRVEPTLDPTQDSVDLIVEMFHDVGGPQTLPQLLIHV